MSTLRESLKQRQAEEETKVSCVTARERQSSLIVSVWAGESWVLPWAQFVSARLDGETIELIFGSTLVMVTGENLPVLLDDIAAYRVAALRQLPPEYHKNLADGEPFIVQIEVRPPTGRSACDTPA